MTAARPHSNDRCSLARRSEGQLNSLFEGRSLDGLSRVAARNGAYALTCERSDALVGPLWEGRTQASTSATRDPGCLRRGCELGVARD
jgi:hypothetical protein